MDWDRVVQKLGNGIATIWYVLGLCCKEIGEWYWYYLVCIRVKLYRDWGMVLVLRCHENKKCYWYSYKVLGLCRGNGTWYWHRLVKY